LKGYSQYIWLIVLVGFFVLFYFFGIRPQSKQRRAHQEMMNTLSKGDVVMTGSGLYGKVVKADDKVVELEVAKGVTMKVARRAIADIIRDKERSRALAPGGSAAKSSRTTRTPEDEDSSAVESDEATDDGTQS
jgi:preprotein translocase subunit YajC